MTTIATALDAALADVTFEPPVAVEDCAMLRDALREVLPTDTSIEVYMSEGNVVVRADGVARVVKVTR